MVRMTEDLTAQKKPFWGPWPTAGFGCGLLVVSVIISMLVVIGFLVGEFIGDSTASIDRLTQDLMGNGLYFSLASIAIAIVCTCLISLIIKIRHTLSISEYLGLRPISIKTILASLAIAAGMVILTDGISYLLGKPFVSEWQMDLYMNSRWPVLLWVALIVFAPAFEETLFRGFLFEGFRQSRIGVIGAVILTALLWALSHIQYGAYGLVTIFVLGIVLGIVRFRTGSLWSTLVMHALINLVAMTETAFYIIVK
jgi:membrane protease YdiL (CAAX protease family)